MTNLKKMGFDESVLDAIWVIRDALNNMTRDISDAAAWLGGIVENVWKVLFTSGNEVEHWLWCASDPDSNAKGGKLTAKVNRLKVTVRRRRPSTSRFSSWSQKTFQPQGGEGLEHRELGENFK